MNITWEISEGIVILTIEGVVGATNAPKLEDTLQQILLQKPSCVLIDGIHLEFMSSISLKILLNFARTILQYSGKLAAANLSAFIRKILATSGLAEIFLLYDTVENALQNLKQPKT